MSLVFSLYVILELTTASIRSDFLATFQFCASAPAVVCFVPPYYYKQLCQHIWILCMVLSWPSLLVPNRRLVVGTTNLIPLLITRLWKFRVSRVLRWRTFCVCPGLCRNNVSFEWDLHDPWDLINVKYVNCHRHVKRGERGAPHKKRVRLFAGKVPENSWICLKYDTARLWISSTGTEQTYETRRIVNFQETEGRCSLSCARKLLLIGGGIGWWSSVVEKVECYTWYVWRLILITYMLLSQQNMCHQAAVEWG